MSFVGVYENIGNPAKRIALITTDYTKEDPYYERMEVDVTNIKTLLGKLGFLEQNILHIHNEAENVIRKEATDKLTPDEGDDVDGYIIMFNLTYKSPSNNVRTKQWWYRNGFTREIFLVNNICQWAGKPKLIFNQNPLLDNIGTQKSVSDMTDGHADETFDMPIDIDIFESFSNDGAEDSYGDANGSFYIQAVCETINQHIDSGDIRERCINRIMCDVHKKIEEKVGQAGSQTPFTKSTFCKKFVFPS